MEATDKTRITDRIISGLRKAATELEEFQLQCALGKAEAKDLYEETKKNFSKAMDQAKGMLDKGLHKGDEIVALFERLQVQLALGKAETKEAFEEQKKRITEALDNLENRIMKNEIGTELYAHLKEEIEKFRIRLNLLRDRFELRRLITVEEINEKKAQFLEAIDELKEKLTEKINKGQDKWEDFKEEMNQTYARFRHSFD